MRNASTVLIFYYSYVIAQLHACSIMSKQMLVRSCKDAPKVAPKFGTKLRKKSSRTVTLTLTKFG